MDEISVNPELSYDQKRDKVIGFTSYYNRTDNCKNVAKHALVFMLKGIKQKWKQAIGYFFSRNLNSDSLESMVKNVIRKVEKNANMKVQCLIFDQATPQWLMAYKLTCSNMRPYFIHPDSLRKTYILLDPPHLLKNVRNALFKYNISYAGGIARLKHLKQFLTINEEGKYDFTTKVRLCHIDPSKVNKMKVKHASQLFSKSVYAGMKRIVD